jgi:hypothetical protein
VVPTFADIPGLGDDLHLGHHRVLLYQVETPIAGPPHETAGKRHCQIEAEPVHMHLGHQIAPWASRWVEHDCASRHGPASTKPRRWASRVLGGMPGWQIVLIAADSALLACALTLLAVRLARRTTPAQPSHP